MGQGVNGHVTIAVGVANGLKGTAAPQRLGEDERNARARRLRKEGWSYRRISASLGMSYAAVCRLLDGEEARIPLTEPVRLPSRAPAPVAAATVATPATPPPAPAGSVSARLDGMAAEMRVVQQRLDMVVAVTEGQRNQLNRLERSLVTTLQTEHRALGLRVHTTVKTLLERMLPSSLRQRASLDEPDDAG